MKRTIRSVKASCDRLWSQAIRSDGVCERCGRGGRLEAHHVYGRTNHRLRWNLLNGVALCHACHRWAEHFPILFTHWFEHRWPEVASILAEENRKGTVRRTLDDYLALEASLRGQLEEAA